MSNSGDLLRLLEPAVRPVPGRAGAAPAVRTPFEGQSFDTLLAQAGGQATAGESAGSAADNKDRPCGALQALSGPGNIENQSLRNLIASHLPADTKTSAPSSTES